MSDFHRNHPDLVGTEADPWMIHANHREALREVECYSRFGGSLDGMIARAEEERDGRMCECGHRWDQHDPDPPGGRACEVAGCTCDEHVEDGDGR